MPRGNYRGPYRAPFDPSITQAVETALREAGRDDVVDLVRKSGMRELETDLHNAKERIHALELDRKKWLTESGMFKKLEERAAKTAISAGKRVANAVLKTVAIAAATGLIGLIGWAFRIVFLKGMHSP